MSIPLVWAAGAGVRGGRTGGSRGGRGGAQHRPGTQ